MQILIQDMASGRYLAAQQRWVEHQEEARSFRTSVEALTFCLEGNFNEVQIVLHFDEPEFDIRIPVLGGRRVDGRKEM